MRPVIGIDFDNTVICYDGVFHRLAVESGLVPAEPPLRQKEVRAAARQSPDGDLAWQRLQGAAYGPRIGEAEPAPGVQAFLAGCHRAGLPVHVISHKTRLAGQDPTGTDLRAAARGWLEARGFFAPGAGLAPERFHCGATRAEKVALIRDLGCTHFIDDLVETFLEPGFPAGVTAILYAPGGGAAPAGVRMARAWSDLAKEFGLG